MKTYENTMDLPMQHLANLLPLAPLKSGCINLLGPILRPTALACCQSQSEGQPQPQQHQQQQQQPQQQQL